MKQNYNNRKAEKIICIDPGIPVDNPINMCEKLENDYRINPKQFAKL